MADAAVDKEAALAPLRGVLVEVLALPHPDFLFAGPMLPGIGRASKLEKLRRIRHDDSHQPCPKWQVKISENAAGAPGKSRRQPARRKCDENDLFSSQTAFPKKIAART